MRCRSGHAVGHVGDNVRVSDPAPRVFEQAGSDFTRFTARKLAQPPKAAFVTGPRQLANETAS